MKLNWTAAGVFAAAAVVAAGAEARAGHGYRYALDTYRIGFDRGFEDGAEHGEKDARHRKGFDFSHDKKYRCADAGYERHYGSRGEYSDGYRRGYELGYRRAYGGWAHRHRGSDRYCYLRHEERYRYGDRRNFDDDGFAGRGDWDDEVIYELPRR